MDILQLKEQHPDEFAREHAKYVEHGLDYEWWDPTYDNFRDRCARLYDLQVGKIWFSGFYSQGDSAGFEGFMQFSKFMSLKKFDEKYPALYVHVSGLHTEVSPIASSRGAHIRGADVSLTSWTTYPTGVFAHLPEDAWDELITAQIDAEDWEGEATRFFCDLADELYVELRDDYEYLTSEEAFIESAIWNELNYEVEA